MVYNGNTAHKHLKEFGGRTKSRAYKRAEWAIEGAINANPDELKRLSRGILEIIREWDTKEAILNNAVKYVVTWYDTVSSSTADRGVRNMEHQSDGISWLIDRIVTDPRTESIYRVDGTGATQLWVLTQDEHANAKVQYDYSGYLIESMDKFGFFDCDVILISNKMIANLPPNSIKIY